jgi:hypothetical protein
MDTSTGLMAVYPSLVALPTVENLEYYGKYIKRSRACSICVRADHMDINLLRARDHKKLTEISVDKELSMDMLTLHFNNHFLLSDNIKTILNIKENTSQESNEIITSILEGNIDLHTAIQAVLESKAQRLHQMRQRIKELSDNQEARSLAVEETQELLQLNKLAEYTENSITKTYKIIRDNLLNMSKEDMENSILSYKYDILKKMIDNVQMVFVEYERDETYAPLVRKMRLSLSERFNLLEETILRTGGVLKKPDGKITD